MTIALVSIAYGEYTKFVSQWLNFISESTIKPNEIIISTDDTETVAEQIKQSKIKQKVEIVELKRNKMTMGYARNKAIEKSSSEWIMYLSIDDQILPNAIQQYQKLYDHSDYICIQWKLVDFGIPGDTKIPPLPYEMAKVKKRKGFIVGHSPFRKSFWEKSKYIDDDYCNYPFLASMVENGARFTRTKKPCSVYLRRKDSHARTVLIKPEQKTRAKNAKRDMDKRIENYYDKIGYNLKPTIRRP